MPVSQGQGPRPGDRPAHRAERQRDEGQGHHDRSGCQGASPSATRAGSLAAPARRGRWRGPTPSAGPVGSEIPQRRSNPGLAVRVPVQEAGLECRHRGVLPGPSASVESPAGRGGCRATSRDPEESQLSHPPAFVRDPSPPRRLRYPDRPRTVGARGREYYHDLHACVESWRARSPEPGGPSVTVVS